MLVSSAVSVRIVCACKRGSFLEMLTICVLRSLSPFSTTAPQLRPVRLDCASQEDETTVMATKLDRRHGQKYTTSGARFFERFGLILIMTRLTRDGEDGKRASVIVADDRLATNNLTDPGASDGTLTDMAKHDEKQNVWLTDI